jgi:hypothetical protein
MKEIKVSNDRIPDIVRAIDEIAFHTSILALNDAVEAACDASSPSLSNSLAANDTLALIEESILRSQQREVGYGENSVALTQSEVLHRLAERVRRMASIAPGGITLPARVAAGNGRPSWDLR